jgi:Kef-type K+ transport system membrane component KefB/voltage-gated potassium channel Kch
MPTMRALLYLNFIQFQNDTMSRHQCRSLLSIIFFLLSRNATSFSLSSRPAISNHFSSPRIPRSKRSSPVQSSLSRKTSSATTSTQLLLAEFPVDVMHNAISSLSSLSLAAADAAQTSDFDALGHDILVFLVASVVVVPLFKFLGISPVLGFLAVGCAIGPYGLQVFSNSEADLQLGDFGILFLLFNEGLSLSPERIKELGKFTGLGVFQLLLSIGMIFVGTFWGGPVILKYVQEIGIPLDIVLLKPVVDNPVQSFCIASAGALSSSAFVLPVLKQKKWEDRPEGIAGLSILLLQDLAVAPLLVILPLLAGAGPSTSVDLGILVTKATVGFGALLVVGSYLLRFVFDIVAAARSTETFVAAALLVAVGMGQAADSLGLSASTGAFAAGVLLAGNRYRAQIQADIKPFEGILLGIFFITAGANLDPALVVNEWLTLLIGVLAFIVVKAGIIFASGPTLGLTRGQAAKVALTLAGGGEFALVLFQLAQDLGVLPTDLSKLLVASVIISMSLTPLLGNLGAYAGDLIDATTNDVREDGLTATEQAELFDQIDTDRSGSIELEELRDALIKLDFALVSIAEVFTSFDTNGDGIIDREEWRAGIEAGLLADALNVNSDDALSTTVNFAEDAIIICGYGEVGKSLYELISATGGSGAQRGGCVCFENSPSRVTAGVLSGAPVVFGDGAKLELLKAAGVTKPRAVIVTFASDSRRLDATMRLRASLPERTPIYVYEGNSRIGKELLEAGATEVISETTETILRFGALLGVCKTEDEISRLRMLSMEKFGMTDATDGEVMIHGLSEDVLIDLAEELGTTRRDMSEVWAFFNSIAYDRDTVPISELKAMLMRQAADGPSDEAALDICLQLEDKDGSGDLTFVEYARAYYGDCPVHFD